MTERLSKTGTYGHVAVWAAIFCGLYLISLQGYLLFHTAVELFSIAVAWDIFFLAWNSRRLLANNYLLSSVFLIYLSAALICCTLWPSRAWVFSRPPDPTWPPSSGSREQVCPEYLSIDCSSLPETTAQSPFSHCSLFTGYRRAAWIHILLESLS